MMSDMAIVSMVRNSSSPTPPSLQSRATPACSRAKMCITNDGLIFFRVGILTYVVNSKIERMLLFSNFYPSFIMENTPFVCFFGPFVKRNSPIS